MKQQWATKNLGVGLLNTESPMDGLGMTSRWVAALRERETLRPDRLFEDPFAGVFAGEEGRRLCAMIESDLPSLSNNRGLGVRTRFLDDMLATAMEVGLRQVVILAAGMDARAYRLKWPDGTVIYEVERPEVLAYKETVLTGLGAVPNADRRPVPIDLQDDFATAIQDAGFVSTEPAAFLVEGLLVYLPDEFAAQRILRMVAGLASPSSRIGLDLVASRLLAMPFLAPVMQRMSDMGASWRYGTDDPKSLMLQAGFSDVQVIESRRVPYERQDLADSPLSNANLVGDTYFLVTAKRT